MNIVAFGASNSKKSINKIFAEYTAHQFTNASIEVLDLNDYSAPLYSIDLEVEIGIPNSIKDFYGKIKSADLIVISLAEHNGSYTAAFKNIFDWLSRLELKFFADKKLLLLSTSPGPRAGLGSMEAALVRFPIHGASILAHFSLPKFQENFNEERGVVNEELKLQYENILQNVKNEYINNDRSSS